MTEIQTGNKKNEGTPIQRSGGGFVFAVVAATGLSFMFLGPLVLLTLLLLPFAVYQLVKSEVKAACPACATPLTISMKKPKLTCGSCGTKLLIKSNEMTLVARDE